MKGRGWLLVLIVHRPGGVYCFTKWETVFASVFDANKVYMPAGNPDTFISIGLFPSVILDCHCFTRFPNILYTLNSTTVLWPVLTVSIAVL